MTDRRILLLVQFDGTDFHGFQSQLDLRTVQQTLEEGLTSLTQRHHRVRASSRTDSGVHARGLPVMVTTPTTLPTQAFHFGLNGFLPNDVAVLDAVEGPRDFDVRRSAQGKVYVYRIWNGRTRWPLAARRSWMISRPLDLERMRRAAEPLLGSHDFSAYRATGCQAATRERNISRIAVEGESGAAVSITVEGNAFLQHMVRIIVGTLVEIGRGTRAEGFAGEALATGDRTKAGQTAPARGLTLHKVRYEPWPWPRTPLN